MDTDRDPRQLQAEAEYQREHDRPLPSALGAGCCPECGMPLALGHGMVEWEIDGKRFSQPCPYSGARPTCEF